VGPRVHLVDGDKLAGAEHHGVLERPLLALRDRVDHRPRVLADIELRRADEVADVLDVTLDDPDAQLAAAVLSFSSKIRSRTSTRSAPVR
jgi:hypothetical protein